MKILIQASANEGKTTVGLMIYKLLFDAGFKVELIDGDDIKIFMNSDPTPFLELYFDEAINKRIKALIDKNKNLVTITTIQQMKERS